MLLKIKQDFGLAFLFMREMVDKIKTEYLDRMKSYLNGDFDKYLSSLNDKETHGLVVNLRKLDKAKFDLSDLINIFDSKLIFKNDGFAYLQYDKDRLTRGGVSVGRHPLYHVGLYYVQEPSAARPIYEAEINESDCVLDLCASPGGKSIETLCCLNKSKGGLLISNEVDSSRVKILLSNIERMGFDNAIILSEKSAKLADTFYECFDKVIVDAPCSGEGMFRKSIDARLQWSESLVRSMAKLQNSLLNDAYKMVKAGGKIVYSTCTFSKEEDEDNVESFLSEHPDMKLLKMEKLFPFEYNGEGQFYAILVKSGESDSDKCVPSEKSLRNINIIRYKIDTYEKKGGEVIPTHASTHIDDVVFENSYELSDEEVIKYLHGDIINVNKNLVDGYYKVTYKNLGLGLAKNVKGIFKNHYPKGLRNV